MSQTKTPPCPVTVYILGWHYTYRSHDVQYVPDKVFLKKEVADAAVAELNANMRETEVCHFVRPIPVIW